MKNIQRMMISSFLTGFVALLFYTFGLLCWDWYGIGLYSFEANLLLAWIIVMFGTAAYYGVIITILYPEEVKRKLAARKWHHF